MTTLITSIPRKRICVAPGEHTRIIGIFEHGWKSLKKIELDVGAHGSADIRFLFLGSKDNAFPLDFTSIQTGAHSTVKCTFRSALFEASSVCGSAVMHITKEGDASDAFFSHHILLLSDKAQGKTIPSLEIETARATAKHAASVSTLDDESMQYLESRGCSEKSAQALLIRGFIKADMNTLDDRVIQKKVEQKIDSFLVLQNAV